MVLPFHTRTACPCLWTLSFTPPVRQPSSDSLLPKIHLCLKGVNPESVPKLYSKDSSMIPRLDVAVDRRRRTRPVRRAAVGGRHAALEPVTERPRGTLPIMAVRAELRAPGNAARQVTRPHRFARLGAHGLRRRLRLAVRTAQTEGSAQRKLHSAFLDAAYRTICNRFCDDPHLVSRYNRSGDTRSFRSPSSGLKVLT